MKRHNRVMMATLFLVFVFESIVFVAAGPKKVEAEIRVSEEEIRLPETEEIIILDEAEEPDLVQETDETEQGPEMIDVGMFKLTAYCNCRKCCGRWAGGPTASGTMPAEGRTVAVDKKVIPLGTRVYIEGYGEFIAEDTGSAIKGNRIDIYMDSHYDARNFAGGNGSCKREVWIVQ